MNQYKLKRLLLEIATYASELECVEPDSCLHCLAVDALKQANEEKQPEGGY